LVTSSTELGATQALGNILNKRHDIQEVALYLHLHQEIYVPFLGRFTSRGGAEHADISRSVLGGDPKYLLALFLWDFADYQSFSASRFLQAVFREGILPCTMSQTITLLMPKYS